VNLTVVIYALLAIPCLPWINTQPPERTRVRKGAQKLVGQLYTVTYWQWTSHLVVRSHTFTIASRSASRFEANITKLSLNNRRGGKNTKTGKHQ